MAKLTLAKAKEILAELQARYEELMKLEAPAMIDAEKAELETIIGKITAAEADVKELQDAEDAKAAKKEPAKETPTPKPNGGKYTVDKILSEKLGESGLKKQDAVFAKAAKKFPAEAVIINAFKYVESAKCTVVVLHAEVSGLRKVEIPDEA